MEQLRAQLNGTECTVYVGAGLLGRTGEVNMVWWAFIIAEVASLALSLVFMARINRTVIVPLSEKQDAAV